MTTIILITFALLLITTPIAVAIGRAIKFGMGE